MMPGRFVKSFATHFVDDNVMDAGAMMAYYAVMALFPMVIFVLSLALLIIPADTVRQGLAMATETMPPSVRDTIADRVQQLLSASGAGFAVLGVGIALWSASRGAVSLMTALNTVYNKKETRSWIRRLLIAIAVTAAVAVIAVIALALLVAGPYVGGWLAARYGLGSQFDTAWNVGRWVGAGVLVMFVWAIAYKFLPTTDAPFRVFPPGAVVGVLVWLGISALFGLYLGHFNSYEATYGALGGAIIFLTWLWLSSIAMLTGAEISDVVADVRKHHDTGARQLADPGEMGAHVDLRKASAQAQHA